MRSCLSVIIFILFISSLIWAEEPASVSSISATTSSEPSGSPKLKAKIDALVWGRSINDDLNHSTAGLTDIVGRMDLLYNSWLTMDLQLEGYWVAGNAKSFYTEESKSLNELFLDEAAANFKPIEDLEIRAGALQTKINPIYSIMSEENTFLSTVQKYQVKLDDMGLVLKAMTVEGVPSSGTVTKGIVDDTPNAYFLTQTLETDLKIPAIDSVVKVAGTHFEFGNLSNNVALDSILIGNNPQSFEGKATNVRYIIGFEGFEWAGSVASVWSKRLETELTASYINNREGPAEGSSGTQGTLKVTTKFGNLHVIPSLTLFKMGADVTPAVYTILPFRYHNREGLSAMLNFELVKEKVSFFGIYTREQVILPDPYLADRDVYQIGLEAKYDIL